MAETSTELFRSLLLVSGTNNHARLHRPCQLFGSRLKTHLFSGSVHVVPTSVIIGHFYRFRYVLAYWLRSYPRIPVAWDYYQNCFILATCYLFNGLSNRNSLYSPVGLWVCLFMFFRLNDISLCMCACFVLPWTVESFPFMFGAGETNLNVPPSSCLLSPHYCGLGAGSIPLRAIVNKKQCETRGLFMSLVIHYWIGDVQDSQGAFIFQNVNSNF